MFDFVTAKKIQKQVALPLDVLLEYQEEGGFFLATCPSLPGCTAQGKTKSEALKRIEEATRNYLERAGQPSFELVSEDPNHPCLHTLSAFYGQLIAGSNRDGIFSSRLGDYGSWELKSLSHPDGQPGDLHLQRLPPEDLAEGQELLDFAPQIYCLAPYTGSGAPKLYAGTSASGSIYESVDGLSWELSYSTGEARVHCLASYRNRLYAGTSAAGKLFCFNGSHWNLVHRGNESAITSLIEFNGEFYMGTYPSGQVFSSGDGLHWRLVYDSGQTFVRAFCIFKEQLYAATSKASGGMVFRSSDGLHWEKVFESRDPNFYCMNVFHQTLWLGTGSNGRLFKSFDGLNWNLAGSFEEEGVRSLEGFNGRLYVATDGRGRLYRSNFTSIVPPEIRNLKVSEATSHSALITWETDRPADSLVRYGTDSKYSTSISHKNLVTHHRVSLSSLESLTQYHFQVLSRCQDGSEAAFSEDQVFQTSTADAVRIQSPTHVQPESWYSLTKAVLSWKAPFGIQGFHICLNQMPDTTPVPGKDGVVYTQEHSATYDNLHDGVWWFHLLAQDQSGHLATQAVHFRLQVDTIALMPKLGSSSHPIKGAWSNRANVVYEWEAPEDLSGIAGYYVLLDQNAESVPGPQLGFWTEEKRFATSLPYDGEWYLHVVSADRAGNVGKQAAHYLIRLDRRADAPVVQSSSHPDPSRWVNRNQIHLSWSAPADASGIVGYYFVLDQKADTVPSPQNGTYTLNTQVSFTGKADGIWYFHLVSQDQAGNVGQEASHLMIRIDTQALPPQISSPSHPAGVWCNSGNAIFELVPAEDLSGIVGYYYCIDRDRSTLPTPETGNYTSERSIELGGLADGNWFLHVISRDAAGNIGTLAAHYAILVDTEALPPRLQSPSHPSHDEWSRQPSLEMVWDPPSDLSGVVSYFYLVDREPDTVPSASSGTRTAENRVQVGPLEDGIWYFHIISQDKAGNVGREASHYKFKIDTQALPPKIISPSHPDKSAWSNNARPRFEWFEPEDLSGIQGYYYCLDRTPNTVPNQVSGFYATQRSLSVDPPLEGDGTWYFHVVSRDKAGNIGSEAAHYPINLDTTAPPPSIQSHTHPDRNAWSKRPDPEFFWNAPEDHSGVVGYYYQLNRSQNSVPGEGNGTWTDQTRVSFNGLEDGIWYLHVVSKDACGNIGKQASHYSIKIDTQALPPVVSSPTQPEGSWGRNPSPTFTWVPPQDLSGIVGYYYVLDNQPVTVPTKETGQFTTSTLASFQRLEDGTHVFHIVSVDQAGNVGVQATHFSIHIDTTAQPPKVGSSTHPDTKGWSKVASPHLFWQPPNDLSGVVGYFYCVDQASHTMPSIHSQWTTETQVTLPSLGDGEWFFHIITRDGAGNLSQEATHFCFRIDTTVSKPKILSKTHPSNDEWFNSNQPFFSWEDGEDLSGIAGHYWVFDQRPGTQISPASSQFTVAPNLTLTKQDDGVWYFHLAAKDKAGNISETAHYLIRIETQAPQSKLEALPPLINQDSFELSWSAKDADSGVAGYDVQVREGDGKWRDWQTQTQQQSAIFHGADGVHYSFRCRAVDKAGNKESWQEEGPFVSITVDLTPPEPIQNVVAKPGPKGSISLTWGAAKDSVSGVAFYRVYRSTAPGTSGIQINQDKQQTRCVYVDSGADLADGQIYYYTVTPVDQAGNECSQGNVQVASICDKTALPPIVSSPTHPIPVDWFNVKKAILSWSTPPDSTAIVGYYYCLDQSLNTVPEDKKGTFCKENQVELGPLADGTWYFHIVSKDQAGNIGTEASHYQINVDTGKPPAPVPKSVSHPQPDVWYTQSNVVFTWNVPNDLSGIGAYLYCLDGQPQTVPDAESGVWTIQTTANFADVGEGIWYFHILAKDKAGNLGEKVEHCRVQVAKTPPPPNVFSPTHPDINSSYSGTEVRLEWPTPPYQPPIVAFRYLLDTDPLSVPDIKAPRTVDGKVTLSNLGEGDWFFHLVSEDGSGRLGKMATHFPIHISCAGSLIGNVTLPNGIMPAIGVSVEVLKEGEPKVLSAKTDKEGRFRFDGLALGTYSVRLLAPNLPPQSFEGIQLDGPEVHLNLSSEICAFPNPTLGAAKVRFSLLAKEEGVINLKIYSEAGKALHSLEVPAKGPGAAYQLVEWDSGALTPGQYLYQSIFKGNSGAISKTPIRKLTIGKK